MNPYASFVNREPLEIVKATATHIEKAVQSHNSAALNRAPAPGKWSVREILCHLADTELVFGFRIRQALAEPHHVIQPFDQDKWAKHYSQYDAHAAAAVFSAVRQWNIALIATLTPELRAKTLNHPERGDMTLQTVIETMAGHDLNHLRQIDAILA